MEADALDSALQSAQKRVEENFGAAEFSPLTSGLPVLAEQRIMSEIGNNKNSTGAFGSPHPAAEDAAKGVSEAVDDIVTPSKQLDFGGSIETPATPVMPAKGDDDVDYNLFIKETLLWSNKIRSSFYFTLGLLVWFAVRAVFKSTITLPTGIAYVLLASLFFNFMRAVLAPKFAATCKWTGSSWTRITTSTVTATIDASAAIHDRHLNGIDPLHTLEVAMLLWLVSILGRALDAVSLLLLLHLASFTLPAAYQRFKTQIDRTVGDVYSKAKAQYDNLGRVPKASAIVGVLVVLAFLLPTLDRIVAVLVILVYGRAILKPAEYANVAKRVEAVASTFKKVGDKATTLAVNTINKYELSPTPIKKTKAQ